MESTVTPEPSSAVTISLLQRAESYTLHYLSHIEPIWLVIGGYSVLAGLFGFFLVGFDKFYAIRGEWRVSEIFMLKVACAGGCWGIAVGMLVFRHKTQKDTFIGFMAGAVAVWFLALREVAHLFGSPPIP